ncbi:amidase domain-containing protein [Lentibacillus halophilus]|uniref:Amidase domain-containing protein n=1 Tax=Lentibacillus halophilus TaxID=295065 RepID=A0ABN0Z971_9BACI
MEMIKEAWLRFFQSDEQTDWWKRKIRSCRNRDANIVRINGHGHVYEMIRYGRKETYHYLLHLALLIRQNSQFIREEQVIPFKMQLENDRITEHRKMETDLSSAKTGYARMEADISGSRSEQRFAYDRRAAVQYAHRWWNSYNPAYRTFDVDCTNYVSQCMRAGGAPMRGAPNREQGWWYQDDNWSYSWAVAHSLRWYLSGSTEGLKGKEMESASDLIPGDIICYDFSGDGRWDHNTIVVDKDTNDMPLVNAHTDNSRNRYWSYEDSLAWTSDTQYKFFRIGE